MATNFEGLQILRTKLYRPHATGDALVRLRLRGILNSQLSRAVTLVCAPAGFGKTTAISDWLEHSPCPNTWLSLDEHDSDLSRFLTYFISAVRTLFPSACPETLALLNAPVLPPPGPLATILSNDLDDLAEDPCWPAGQRFILVLDDYQLVNESAVHTLLGDLLRHPPRTLHLVLSARHDPPFPLHALRARGELGEIRTQDLRFSPEEVASFMEQALGAPLDQDALGNLVQRTEGWATGLRLAALSLSTGGNAASAGSELVVDNRFVLDYLVKEVLARVPAATQDFLLATSILARMTGPLCDALAGLVGARWDGGAFLEWLAAENLFTFSLDAKGTWYRYHHVFQALLQKHLARERSAQEIAELHRRASAWFEENGLMEEALEHALAAGDEMGAARLVEANRHGAMNQEHWRQLEHWLGMMPRRVVDARSELLLLEAWILFKQWRPADIPPYLDRCETLMQHSSLPDADRVRLNAEVDALRSAVFYYFSDAPRTRDCVEKALGGTPLECSFVRGMCWFYYGAARQMIGDVRGAIEAYREGLKEDRLQANSLTARLYLGLCFIYWMNGDMADLLLTAAQLLELARRRDLSEARAWALYWRGCALYQLNDLAEAEESFKTVLKQRYLAHGLAASHSGFGLASVSLALGATDQAREAVDATANYGLEMSNSRVLGDVEAFRAVLALHSGATAAAERWAAASDPRESIPPMATFQVALALRVRVLLHTGTPANLAQAGQVLDRLQGLASSTHNTRYLIEALALRALLLDARGDRARAIKMLEEAIALAQPGGIIRVFVDLGPRLAAILRQFATLRTAPPQHATEDYLVKLLAAFGALDERQVPPNPVPPAMYAASETGRSKATRPASRPDELIEPLSERELDVLALLAEWMTNKEVARELNISPQTVKRHTVNIYQKLLVDNRRAAVEKAAELGLLPDTGSRGRRRIQSTWK